MTEQKLLDALIAKRKADPEVNVVVRADSSLQVQKLVSVLDELVGARPARPGRVGCLGLVDRRQARHVDRRWWRLLVDEQGGHHNPGDDHRDAERVLHDTGLRRREYLARRSLARAAEPGTAELGGEEGANVGDQRLITNAM